MKIKSAKGVRGHLLWSGNDYFFRVYDKDDRSRFTDYDLVHSDLEITIEEEDSCLYEHEDGENTLDHSPETLGIE